MVDWENQLMFESYLQDYLFKINMHKTAELFRIELNRMMDHIYPPRTVVPEGFLQEWWSGCFDFDNFKDVLETNMGCTAGEAPSDMELTMENQSLEATQAWDDSQAEQYPAVLSREFDSMELNVIDEVALLYFPNLYVEMYGNLPQLLLPSSHHEEQLRPTLGAHNVANASGQNAESSIQYTLISESAIVNEESDPVIENLINSFWLLEQCQMEQFGKGESNGNMKNLPECGERYIGINEFANFTMPLLCDDENNIHQLEINSAISESSSMECDSSTLLNSLMSFR